MSAAMLDQESKGKKGAKGASKAAATDLEARVGDKEGGGLGSSGRLASSLGDKEEGKNGGDSGKKEEGKNAPKKEPKGGEVKVQFSKISAGSTPAKMKVDRIAPRIAETVKVTIAGKPTEDVVLKVEGGGSSGEATVQGKKEHKTKASGSVSLKGTKQTAPGNAGTLKLTAYYAGAKVGESNAFTVCAIPENFSITFQSLIDNGTKLGVRVQNKHKSDSGVVADLDKVEISEVVSYSGGKGIFAGITSGNNSSYRSGTAFPTDSHGVKVSALTGEGSIPAQQVFKFKDGRSGVTDIPVKNSGFEIKRVVKDSGGNKFKLTTSKTGKATTSKGISTGAGSGSVTKTQDVP